MKIETNADDLYEFFKKEPGCINLLNDSKLDILYKYMNDTLPIYESEKLVPTLTAILYASGLDPLNIVTNIPERFAFMLSETDLDISPLIYTHTSSKCFEIGYEAFYSCDYIESLEAPTVKSISNYAFFYCANLKEVLLKDCVMIYDNAFSTCNALKSFYFPDNLISIKPYAFEGCKNLKHISINNVSKLHLAHTAFEGCDNLTDIDFRGSQEQFVSNKSVFFQCSEALPGRIVHCTDGNVEI